MSIKNKKLLYHITNIENLESILGNGLLPRSQLTEFIDVADHEILSSRRRLRLEDYVPFHFFARNPFDGNIQDRNRNSTFVLITMTRSFACANGWKITPKHPLANENLELLEYEEGMEIINWDKMDERDYSDAESKSVCMAECLSPDVVLPNSFQSIFVNDEASEEFVENLLEEYNLNVHVNINTGMFLR